MQDEVKKQVNLELNVSIAALAVDGNALSIDENGNASLFFFQVIGREGDGAKANAVANIRLNKQQLQQLNDTITEALSTSAAKK